MSRALKVSLRLTPQPEGGYTVTSPQIPELVTEGDTVEDALDNVRDALSAVVELYQDMDRPLPPGTSVYAAGDPLEFEALLSLP